MTGASVELLSYFSVGRKVYTVICFVSTNSVTCFRFLFSHHPTLHVVNGAFTSCLFIICCQVIFIGYTGISFVDYTLVHKLWYVLSVRLESHITSIVKEVFYFLFLLFYLSSMFVYIS